LGAAEAEAHLRAEARDLADRHHDLAAIEHPLVNDQPAHVSGLRVQNKTADGAHALAGAVDDARAEWNQHAGLPVGEAPHAPVARPREHQRTGRVSDSWDTPSRSGRREGRTRISGIRTFLLASAQQKDGKSGRYSASRQ